LSDGTFIEPLNSFKAHVKQKTGLNKSILKSRLDQGWGEFRRQMKYKMIWTGGLLVPVPPHRFD
jgi:putative transposase